MMMPDVNVLLAALRSDHVHHEVGRRWLVAAIKGEERFAVSTLVLGAVVRIATNVRVFPRPTDAILAIDFCDNVLAQPQVVRVEPADRHWPIFSRFVAEGLAHGPLVTDAWYAALAIEWGCEWLTFDRDYARFPGLRWRVPG